MRLLLVGLHTSIEPLGIMHLAGAAQLAGWEVDVCLVRDREYGPVLAHVGQRRPDLVGISVWTGGHRQALAAAREIEKAGVRVAVGGPHATYFAADCARHATWVIRGPGFRLLHRLLAGLLPAGIHVDPEAPDAAIPIADRETVYSQHPELGASPIKSIMASFGCPFRCTYCYNSASREIYRGRRPLPRPVDEVIAEGIALRDRWPTRLVFMADDLFGADTRWLEEFAIRWPAEVGLPWHCQIRLELTRDERRLDVFRAGGCTGVTLAVESASPFLRRYVLGRAMADDLIEQGVRRLQARGLTVRTEQMLGAPFSTIASDLDTLRLNVQLEPTMAWASILAPYRGTPVGEMAVACGLYAGSNDDLTDSFFDRSVLRHVRRGWRDVERLVVNAAHCGHDNPLLRLHMLTTDRMRATLGLNGGGHAAIEYLSEAENRRLAGQQQALQQLFPWFARWPRGDEFARRWLSHEAGERTWRRLGQVAEETDGGGPHETTRLATALREEMACDELPEPIARNPWYCATLPGSGLLARRLVTSGALEARDPWPDVARITRSHLFETALYRTTPASPPIAIPHSS